MKDADYKADDRDRAWARRFFNRSRKRCINENLAMTHGEATHGVRCFRCHIVKRHGSARVNELGLEAFVQGNE